MDFSNYRCDSDMTSVCVRSSAVGGTRTALEYLTIESYHNSPAGVYILRFHGIRAYVRLQPGEPCVARIALREPNAKASLG